MTTRHIPKVVPIGLRLFYLWLAGLWTAWCALGLLSGHMVAFVGVPLHYEGRAAVLLAAGVTLWVAIAALKFIDHFDTRDNEAWYAAACRRLLRGSLFLVVLASGVGLYEAFVPPSPAWDYRPLLNARQVLELLQSPWLAARLQPLELRLARWSLWGLAWIPCVMFLYKVSGASHQTFARRPLAGALWTAAAVMPLLTPFTLLSVYWVATGLLLDRNGPDGEAAYHAVFLATFVLFLVALWIALAGVTLLRIAQAAWAPRQGRISGRAPASRPAPPRRRA